MSADARDLVAELRKEVEDERRAALVDAYVEKPSADVISAKALELLAEDIDAIDEP